MAIFCCFFPLVFFLFVGRNLKKRFNLKRREGGGGIKVLSNRTADLPVVTERATSERAFFFSAKVPLMSRGRRDWRDVVGVAVAAVVTG